LTLVYVYTLSQQVGKEFLQQVHMTLQLQLEYEQPQQPGTTTVLLRKPGYRETTLELSQSSDEERAAELVLLAAPTSGKNPAARQLAKRPKRTGTQAGVKTNDLLIDFKSGKKLGGR